MNNPEILRKLVAKPSFKRIQIFHHDLVGVENVKTKVLFNRPTYTGFVILDLAKMVMADFHFNVMKKKYDANVNTLFTDTDSVCYKIMTDDLCKDLSEFSQYFDFSNYPPDHTLYNLNNASIPGLMKDESCGIPIDEFVGLRPKMYSLKYGNQVKKTAKGINKINIEKDLTHQHYRDCLFNQQMKRSVMDFIRSRIHTLYLETVNKIGLSPFCDKRYHINDIESYAFGHFQINNEKT